jgi:hypothetical protein
MRKLSLMTSGSALSAALTSVLLVGCAAEDGAVPPGGSGTGESVGVGGSGGGYEEPCTTDGEQRQCQIHNDYGCVQGTETCEGGTWSECTFGSSEAEERILRPAEGGTRLPAPDDARWRVGNAARTAEVEVGEGRVGHPDGVVNRAVGDPCTSSAECNVGDGEYCGGPLGSRTCHEVVECGEAGTIENVCDPECRVLEPTPADFTAPGTPQQSGGFGATPSVVLNAGLPNNCNEAANQNDCHFDHHCVPEGNGECVAWGAGEADPACVGQANITIGLPCADGFPVCNRGLAPSSGGGHFDHNFMPPVVPGDFSDDNLPNPGAPRQNCDYDVGVIQPGQCVMLPFDCGTPLDLTDDILPGEVVSAHGPSNECNDNDNISYHPVGAALTACGGANCGGGVNVSLGPVDLAMFTLIDRSVSMNGAKVDTVCRGIRAFTQDVANVGIGFEYKEWPDDDGSGCSSCCGASGGCNNTDWRGNQACWGAVGPGAYVGLQPLPGSFAAPGGPPCTFPGVGLATYNSGTSFYTPLLAALRGARHSARLEKMANPDKAVVIVLVTDAVEIGGNDGCSTTDIRNEVEEALDDDGVFTAVVGIGITCGGAACNQANNIASWGGTGQAIFLPGSGSPTLLNQAMQNIRNSFSCNRTVPNPLPGGVTIDDIDITWNLLGVPIPIDDRVANAAACNVLATDQYYFDGVDTLSLCPTTCNLVTGAVGSNVEFDVPCGPQVVPVTGSEAFTLPDGSCPEGYFPKWTQMFVDGDFPGGSTISVEAHTLFYAADVATYPNPEWVPIITIDDATTNPIDLFTPLDAFNEPPAPERDPALTPPQGYGEFIEFQFTSTPGSVDDDGNALTPNVPIAPTIDSYEVHFTCEATE